MLIDRQQVAATGLDFRPELTERLSWSKRRLEALSGNSAAPGAAPGRSQRHAGSALRRFGWRLLDVAYRAGYPILSRQLIGSARDTGWKVWAEFGRRGRHRAETVLPVVDIDAEFTRPAFLTTRLGRLLDNLVPSRFRFLPKPDSYVAPGSTCGFDSPEFRALAAEAFVWHGRPFAFHLRRHISERSERAEDEAAILADVLTRLANGP